MDLTRIPVGAAPPEDINVVVEIPRGGEPVTIEFAATAAGQFPILCSEYCGDGHEDMKGMLVVAAKASK